MKYNDNNPYKKVESSFKDKLKKFIINNPVVKIIAGGIAIGVVVLASHFIPKHVDTIDLDKATPTSTITSTDENTVLPPETEEVNLDNLIPQDTLDNAEKNTIIDSAGNVRHQNMDGFKMQLIETDTNDEEMQKYLVDVNDLNGQEKMFVCEAKAGSIKVNDVMFNLYQFVEISTGQIIAQVHAETPFIQDNCAVCTDDGKAVPTSINAIYALPLEQTKGLTAGAIYNGLRIGQIGISDALSPLSK